MEGEPGRRLSAWINNRGVVWSLRCLWLIDEGLRGRVLHRFVGKAASSLTFTLTSLRRQREMRASGEAGAGCWSRPRRYRADDTTWVLFTQRARRPTDGVNADKSGLDARQPSSPYKASPPESPRPRVASQLALHQINPGPADSHEGHAAESRQSEIKHICQQIFGHNSSVSHILFPPV